MTGDDLRRIFLSPTLFRLDTILSPRLVPILYGIGLLALLVWAVTHLFATFGRNFGDGLWGLLEIGVFGLLGVVVLRIVCEFLLVFFKANETVTRAVSLSLISTPLVEDVREAIHDIAADEDYPVTDAAPEDEFGEPPAPRRSTVRRTARRTPRPPATSV